MASERAIRLRIVCDWNDPHRQQAEDAPLNVRHQSCIAAEVSDGE